MSEIWEFIKFPQKLSKRRKRNIVNFVEYFSYPIFLNGERCLNQMDFLVLHRFIIVEEYAIH